MPKKIVILANNSGGLYDFRGMLMSELKSRGDTVIALTPFDDRIEELNRLGVKLIETPINRRGINPVEDLKLFRNYKKLLMEINPDLVITYTIKPNVYGGFACRLLKIPYAANITGIGTAFPGKGILRKLVTLMYKVGLKKAKTVFFENSGNRQIFIDEKIVKEGKTCLLNGAGVNIEHFGVAEYPEDDGTTKFLFVGRVMKEKGIDELFKAMKLLREDGVNCILDVVGGCEEDYTEKLKGYESEGWLNYHGYQKDVRPFIKNASCFVLPSWHEGMANTNLECSAMARPVITSNIHGCLEAVEDGVTGFLCEKQNAEMLYNTMNRFCNLTYAEKKNMGLSARRRMEEIFDKKKVVKDTIANL